MELCFMCHIFVRLRLTKRNYKNWSALIIDHLRREHKEVFPFLCSKELPSNYSIPIKIIMSIIYFSVNDYCFDVIDKFTDPYDIWMALWKAYGDPKVPPFPEDILPPVTLVMVPITPVVITPPNAHVSSIDLVPATNALDLVQQTIPCLPTSASWDDFLP